MTSNRRDVLRGAAFAGAFAGAGALAGCGKEKDGQAPEAIGEDDALTTRAIAQAEKVQGLSFTPDERALMLDALEKRRGLLAALRAQDMPDELAPALLFDPRPPGKSIGAQRNELILGARPTPPLPSSEDDIAYASAMDQGAWLRAGVLSCAALTEIYLARIERFDPRLRAFITPTPEIARAQAARADEDFARGRDRGPLHGLPYGLKDVADVDGVKTSWGARLYKDRISDRDAEVVRKLERAGAVLLGKTACGALAYGDQWFDARTRNPWNPREGSSGSSAGSASAVAAGLCGFAIGSETLGSIISPSERCGTAGLRPTFGRVSRHGFMTLAWSLDKVGPLCRKAEDAALILSALNGYDQDDPATARVGFAYDGGLDLAGLKVGYVPAWFDEGDAVDRAALDAMVGLGVTLTEFPWPEFDFRSLAEIVRVESAAAFSALTLSNRDDALEGQGKDAWPNIWRGARFLSAVDYVQIDRLRGKLIAELNAAFDQGFDALIGPHDGGGALLATNMTGHPQLALRAGFAQKANRTRFGGEEPRAAETHRVPRGVSLWGDLFQEGKIIALGRALETVLGVVDVRPPGF